MPQSTKKKAPAKKAVPKKPPPDPDLEEEEDPDLEEEEDDDDGDEETIEEVVRRVLSEELPAILGDLGDDEDPDDKGGKPKPRAQRSQADMEGIAERAIRNAMATLDREGKSEKRIAKIEERLKEEAPRQVRRVERAMWGSPDKAR